MPDLEERVAALEATVAMLTSKLLQSGDITINDARVSLPPFPDLKIDFSKLNVGDPIKEGCRHIMTGGCPLDLLQGPVHVQGSTVSDAFPAPDEIRHLLSECVTAVKPGETLVVRVPWNVTPRHLHEYQRVMDSAEGGQIPFRVLVVAGDELGVVREPDFMTRTTTEPLDGEGITADSGHLTIRLVHQPTGIEVVARDRPEGIVKLRKALTDRARREFDLQEAQRRAERKAVQAQEAQRHPLT